MGPERLGARTPLSRGLPAAALLCAVAAGSVEGQQAEASPAVQSPSVAITFLDVGQGDAVVVRAPGGQVLMVDAGPEAPLRALSRLGVDSIDLLVGTHPHPDHIGGMQGVLTARPVRRYLGADAEPSSDLARGVDATLDRISGVTRLAAEARRLEVGELTVDVLPPTAAPGVDGASGAPSSVGLVIRYGSFSALLPGDAEHDQLTAWTDAGLIPEVTLLKASHHGSAAGFTIPFLEAARPELVVISVGGDNPRGHPRPQALTGYRSVASRLLRTDVHGHVTVRGFRDGTYAILAGPDLDDPTPLAPDVGRVEPVMAERPTSGGATAGSAPPLAMSVTVDAPGFRGGDRNADYASIVNLGATAVDLSGWRLCDLSTRCFRFPAGTRVLPGRRVVVYTGYGMPDGTSFFMNNDRRVWNQDGDEATLYDAEGRMVLRHVY